MKKLSLLFVMLVTMAIGVKAQGHFLIPTIGYNLSSVVTSGYYYYDIMGKQYDVNNYVMPRYGFCFGLDYRYEFRKPFLIEAGFHYNNYGFRLNEFKNGSTKTMWDYNERLTHLSGQIMFGYKFVIGQSRIFSITPKIGIQLGGYNNVYYKYTALAYDSQNVFINQSNEKKESFKKHYDQGGFDVSEIATVEFGWNLNDVLGIFVSVNNRWSFKNILKDDHNVNGNAKMYNYGFSANVGLKVKLGD